MLKRSGSLFLCLFVLAACSGEVEDTRPGQPVSHRQQAFKAILRAFEPMGVALRSDKYEAKTFAAQAHQLQAIKDGPWSYFGADTNYPPTKAKPTVWSDPAGFARERDALLAGIDALVLAADSGSEAEVRGAYSRVHGSCKSCHDAFKN